MEVLDYIYSKKKTQKKKIEALFSEMPGLAEELEFFLKRYLPILGGGCSAHQKLGDSYLKMSAQMAFARLQFLRDGKYPTQEHGDAIENVYQNRETMLQYMLGLALSQYLWKHHYRLFQFYQHHVDSIEFKPGAKTLEVGCGHGLYLLYLLEHTKHDLAVDVVDISETSIDLARDLIARVLPEKADRVNFVCSDIQAIDANEKYQFITFGELLEHVHHPDLLLQKLHGYLADDGYAYVSTCANCPAIDHLYHFETIEQIREMIKNCGYDITSEIIAPSEDKPMEELIRKKIDISYGAIIRKGKA